VSSAYLLSCLNNLPDTSSEPANPLKAVAVFSASIPSFPTIPIPVDKATIGLEKKEDVIPVKPKVDVLYQVWDDTLNKWLPNVKNLNDYAGIYGHNICCVLAHLSEGNITYKVHCKGGKWLPAVVNRTDYAGLYNKTIDGLMMKTDTGKTIHYAVHLRKKNKWLPFVTGYNEKDDNNGYAGIIGQEIDGIKIYID
jgi:hypothetical protein